jgi:hypothetical protein
MLILIAVVVTAVVCIPAGLFLGWLLLIRSLVKHL